MGFCFANKIWSRITTPQRSSIDLSVNWSSTQSDLRLCQMDDIDIDDAPDHTWISGDMLGITHRRLIDVGGAGEVHEVQ